MNRRHGKTWSAILAMAGLAGNAGAWIHQGNPTRDEPLRAAALLPDGTQITGTLGGLYVRGPQDTAAKEVGSPAAWEVHSIATLGGDAYPSYLGETYGTPKVVRSIDGGKTWARLDSNVAPLRESRELRLFVADARAFASAKCPVGP